ncbi:unnamed protein product [Eruca vesicaria subsp. sativa]|uniref:F-box associated beta-propeller type 3 domain-containing protein n=1 Tax=Eruca vesicaria subsp. sativa TaxID=29727 RepID=A0ABC8JBF6_ERUVS|nr:unnamed protein product [Eruca vesicaria subsp. sativa]
MTRPRILFTSYHRESQKSFIFSAPEYDNKDDDIYSSVMARYDMTISDPDYYMIYGSVNGFYCFVGVSSNPLCNLITVYNPTTRQIVKLPDVMSNGRHVDALLGYDPVKDQYKVLCVVMFEPERQDNQHDYFVCTLSSSQKQEWRKIENPIGDSYNDVVLGHTCIDGALYYGVGESRMVRFDVRSEKIEFIKIPKTSHISTLYHSALINYNGKLGGLERSDTENLMTLWVLEDAEKLEWSSMTCDLPYQDATLASVVPQGMIHGGDSMVFCPPFCVCYYDFEKKSIRTVEIRGIEDGDRDLRLLGFGELIGETLCHPSHIENIRFL